MRFKITGQDWGEELTPIEADTKDEVIDKVLCDIRDSHPGAIIKVEDTEGEYRTQTIDLSGDFALFGIEFA